MKLFDANYCKVAWFNVVSAQRLEKERLNDLESGCHWWERYVYRTKEPTMLFLTFVALI